GVKVRFGKIIGIGLTEGLHFKVPFIDRVIKMNVKTQKIQSTMDIYTKDIQQARLTFSINYNLHKNKSHNMYLNVGQNWEDVLLQPLIMKVSKDVIGKWDAVDLIENRDKAGRQILSEMQQAVENIDMTVTGFAIENIDYSDVFEDAIEAKVVASQRANEAENKTRQISEEAKQKLIAAQAEAKAMTIKAQALAQNKSLINYEAVQKWDGKMPTVTGGSIPFLNLDLKK
ncbi:MAG: prohibitin family protein, partial [Alphaproteobacteria bacterium]|nr:prohibitin family protein [Alphaproteobacteria bacterium]